MMVDRIWKSWEKKKKSKLGPFGRQSEHSLSEVSLSCLLF